MRKIPSKYENPIDDILLDFCELVCPYFNKINMTPNMITTIADIIFIISLIFIYKEQYIIGAILFFLAYIFDCIDGHYARKYDMVTIFGDYYDHIGDLLKIIVITYVLYNLTKKKLFIGIIFILWITMLIHLGCQEEVYNNSEQGGSFKILRNCCKYNPEKKIIFTRLFGCGTFYIIVAILIATLSYTKIHK
jgi:phosphatidylglycerophosphate synthase